jgi:anaerobic dimethyl sulfoxide reductase subunit A
VKPGTDSAFMLAVLWVLIDEGLIDRDYLRNYSQGFELFEAYVTGADGGQAKTPAWAEEVCGYPAGDIIAFARRYGGGERTALLPGLSLQRAVGGENADRLGAVLQLATGNAGKLGGSTGAGKWNRLPGPRMGTLPVPPNPLGFGVPVNQWPDAVLEGRSGGYPSNISFLYNVGGNYIGQGSDTAKSIRAFDAAEFSVTHDYFLTDTARHSDVVLPVTTFLEREDIVSAPGNYLLYSAKAIDPIGGARNDFDIFSDLADRLGFGEEFTDGRSEEEWLEHLLDQSEITDREEFLRTGYYAGKDWERIGLAAFFADPKAHPLATESGKIEIASPRIRADGGTLLPEHQLIETTEEFPLRMITPHERYRVHSQNDNVPSLKKLCDDRLWINLTDARARDIADGERVEVTSPDGRVEVEAFVTDRIGPGSVSLNQGVWAMGAHGGANANWLTSTESTVPAGATRTHSIIVNVKRT